MATRLRKRRKAAASRPRKVWPKVSLDATKHSTLPKKRMKRLMETWRKLAASARGVWEWRQDRKALKKTMVWKVSSRRSRFSSSHPMSKTVQSRLLAAGYAAAAAAAAADVLAFVQDVDAIVVAPNRRRESQSRRRNLLPLPQF